MILSSKKYLPLPIEMYVNTTVFMCSFSGSYEEARRKLNKAKETSDIQSTDYDYNESDQEGQRRSRRANK